VVQAVLRKEQFDQLLETVDTLLNAVDILMVAGDSMCAAAASTLLGASESPRFYSPAASIDGLDDTGAAAARIASLRVGGSNPSVTPQSAMQPLRRQVPAFTIAAVELCIGRAALVLAESPLIATSAIDPHAYTICVSDLDVFVAAGYGVPGRTCVYVSAPDFSLSDKALRLEGGAELSDATVWSQLASGTHGRTVLQRVPWAGNRVRLVISSLLSFSRVLMREGCGCRAEACVRFVWCST
jgi:hypothetical protein